MSPQTREVHICALQFSDRPLKELAARLGQVEKDGRRVVTGLELGSAHFDWRGIVNPTSRQETLDKLRGALSAGNMEFTRVSAHPNLMALDQGAFTHTGFDPFMGDLVARDSAGNIDVVETRRRSFAEAATIFEACQLVGVSVVNLFTGTQRWALESGQFPALPAAERERLMNEEAETYEDLARIATPFGIKKILLEAHPGQPALDPISMVEFWNLVRPRCPLFGYKVDPSHWQMVDIGIGPADGVDYLHLHAPGLVAASEIHLKGGIYEGGRIAGAKSSLPLKDRRRSSRFVAVHLVPNALHVWTDFMYALNVAGLPYDVPLVIEHEDDRLPALDLNDTHPALNAVVESAYFCHRYLTFHTPSAGHQERMGGEGEER